MAVVQISRIQVRRGKKQETGMPQLASGEIAWAVDTQELYIGNGSVSEGSPAVGNTKILTQNDLTIQGNLLNLLQHIYKADDTSIQTGPTANNPISRSVQDRLDDRVSVFDFGALGNGVTDDTVALQRAIDQLFFNSATQAYDDNYLSTNSSDWNANAVTARRILEIPAGKYVISGTLYIPSYATIVGAGADKTILQFSNASTSIKFINDSYPDTASIETNTQSRFITLTGLTVYTNTSDQIALDMYAVRDSQFTDIILRGSWSGSNENSIGIKLQNYLAVSSQRNIFDKIVVHGFTYGIFSDNDILNNVFINGHIYDTKQGVVFGKNADGFSPGQITGPTNNTFDNFNFESIKQHALSIEKGTANTIRNSRLTQVGQDGGGVIDTSYPQIYFAEYGNSSENNSSDRWEQLATDNLSTPYLPEVTGWASNSSYGSYRIALGTIPASPALAFRLPLSTDSGGAPRGNIMYVIDYLYQSTINNFSRRGKLTISANVDLTFIKLSDEYDYAGPPDPSLESAINLDFSARFRDISNADIDPADFTPNDPWTIAVKYVNPLDTGYFTYTYTAIQSYIP